MKLALIAFAVAGATLCSPVFAQSVATASTNSVANTAPADPSTSLSQAGQWVPPYGKPVQGLTRAQVYQDLVHAEKDGQYQYLNQQLYSHG
ncbi:DUF4148 domain-containing protein [Paraburkholderia rhizosphaerae]|uniref:Uncharacterized protein DUF4148 n=1 Tax=Paraburkholderia rhizosphaerae TaxID=480658 RepID=A0A4V3HFP2_9BURK|nr:DUF4148 domain-containing protein [Paraburkholderia rhizosphaerae]TDY54219.1 uncharacterized protein DUF4148 [Paraburkholderia rhizosphaerae]